MMIEMKKQIWNILSKLACLILLGKLIGFDHTKVRHWLILVGLGAVILSIVYVIEHVGILILNRYAAKIKDWYVRFSKRPMNITTIFYVTAIALPVFIGLFSISGLLWSILGWFYRLFQV
jgi:amino acid transporter